MEQSKLTKVVCHTQAWDHKHGAGIFGDTESDRIRIYDLVQCLEGHGSSRRFSAYSQSP